MQVSLKETTGPQRDLNQSNQPKGCPKYPMTSLDIPCLDPEIHS